MTKLSENWVNAYFDHGVDTANRRVFLDSDIEDQSISHAIKGLYLMETESNTQPCEMFISSYGGSLYDAIALYDIMNTLKCPIYTFAYGKCMSSALILLAAGKQGHRWVAPHAFFMHHDWSLSVEGRGASLEADFKHNMELSKTWTNILVKYSCKDFRWWETRAKRAADFYFTADEAIDWGIADNIWVEK